MACPLFPNEHARLSHGSNLAGLTSNLTALGCNLPSRDDLLHDTWRLVDWGLFDVG